MSMPSRISLTRRRLFAAMCVVVIVGAGCSVHVTAPDLYGRWGGQHVGLQVTAQGAILEYDCAHGAIDMPLAPNAQGRFVVDGTHTVEHGGPVGEDETPVQHPARYRGWTNGSKMILEVTLLDTGALVGEFSLELNQEPRLFKCL